MKVFFQILTAFFLSLAPLAALAKDCPECDAWKSGHGARPGKPTSCIVTISAPTFGGKIGLDVRTASRESRWGAPRIKHVGPGTVTYRIGCGWLEEPTAEVYLCVDGGEGKQFSSIRWRSKGDLQKALETKKLEMCLKGAECSRFQEGSPPAH